jgi:hypothetical protein
LLAPNTAFGPRRPPQLKAFLDNGGDISVFPGLEGLAEAVIVRRRLNTPQENGEAAALCRGYVDQWLCGEPTALDPMLAPDGPSQALVTAFAWAAECYGDCALAERLEQHIPQDLYLEHIEWVGERKARAVS